MRVLVFVCAYECMLTVIAARLCMHVSECVLVLWNRAYAHGDGWELCMHMPECVFGLV